MVYLAEVAPRAVLSWPVIEATAGQTDSTEFTVPFLLFVFGFVTLASFGVRRIRLRGSGSPAGTTPLSELGATVVDLRTEDTRRHGLSVRRLTGRLVGLATSLLIIMPTGSEPGWERVAVIVFSVASGSGVWWLIVRKARADATAEDPRQGHGRWVRSGRRRIRGALLLGLSYFGVLTAVVGVIEIVVDMQRTEDETRQRAAQLGVDESMVSLHGVGYLFVGIVAALLLDRAARRVTLLNARDVIAVDSRPPILLLRSFADDECEVRMTPQPWHGLMGKFGMKTVGRFEEAVTWRLAVYGPVVTISEPGRRRQRLGAARERIESPDWLSVIADKVDDAGAIVVILGDVGQSPGLRSEIELLAECGALDRTIFVVPPIPSEDAQQRWSMLALSLGVDQRLPDSGSTPVIRITGGEVIRYLTTTPIRDTSYAVALDAAFTGHVPAGSIDESTLAWPPPHGPTTG